MLSQAAALPAAAQDAYVIGLTGEMTGSTSRTYSPAVEAIRLYFDSVNTSGGINGKPVQLNIRDKSSEPSKATADVKG